MADFTDFDSITLVNLLRAFHRSLASDSSKRGNSDFVGTILERNLKDKFERDRSASGFADKERAAEMRQFDVTFLMIKKANRALKDLRPDLAIGIVERALALWIEPSNPLLE